MKLFLAKERVTLQLEIVMFEVDTSKLNLKEILSETWKVPDTAAELLSSIWMLGN